MPSTKTPRPDACPPKMTAKGVQRALRAQLRRAGIRLVKGAFVVADDVPPAKRKQLEQMLVNAPELLKQRRETKATRRAKLEQLEARALAMRSQRLAGEADE